MTYLLDTDLFTLAHLGRPGPAARIAAARTAGVVGVSIVTQIEVLRGRFDAVVKAADGAAIIRALDRLRSSEAFLAGFLVLPFDAAAVAAFDRLRIDKSARKAGRNDLLVACVALAHAATLVTRNAKDFAHVPGLRLENGAA